MAIFSDLPREIQLEILNQLVTDKTSLTTKDRNCLLSAMRVNTFWFDHTTDILWNNVTKLEVTLATIDTVERRQLYISKIRSLSLHTSRIHLDQYRDLRFMSLRRLALRGDHQGIFPFLQQNLEVFHFRCNFHLSPHELDQMTVLCPKVRELHILPSNRAKPASNPNPVDPVDPETFSRFLHNSRCLRVLSIGKSTPEPLLSAALSSNGSVVAAQLEKLMLVDIKALSSGLSGFLEACTSLRTFEMQYKQHPWEPLTGLSNLPGLLGCLAALPNLERLRLDHDFTGDMVEQGLKGHSAPFRRLRYLAVEGEMLTVSHFFSLSMQSLTGLDLVVNDPLHHVCSYIGRNHDLTDLKLTIGVDRSQFIQPRPGPKDWEATQEDLIALSSLKKLRSLSIDPCGINLAAPWLTDDYFSQWIMNFPHLLDLHLDWECPLTFASIVALSKSHPQLRQCQLLWTQELGEWDDLPSLGFVSLKRLGLDLVTNFDRSNIRELVTKFIKRPINMSTSVVFGAQARVSNPDRRFIDEEPDERYIVRLTAQAATTE